MLSKSGGRKTFEFYATQSASLLQIKFTFWFEEHIRCKNDVLWWQRQEVLSDVAPRQPHNLYLGQVVQLAALPADVQTVGQL